MNKNISIAIDGPAGSGKSTIGKLVAQKLNFKYINSGLLYRAIAYFYKINNLDSNCYREIINGFKKENIKFISDTKVIYKNKNIINDLTSDSISLLAAKFAAVKEIRIFCIDKQRKMAKNLNVVMDGRDITSVVLKNAQIKIYMWAEPEERARRRFKQYSKNGYKCNFDQILKEIKERDYNDINRKYSPLIQSKDSIKIDTTNSSIKNIVNKIIVIVKKETNV